MGEGKCLAVVSQAIIGHEPALEKPCVRVTAFGDCEIAVVCRAVPKAQFTLRRWPVVDKGHHVITNGKASNEFVHDTHALT